MSEEYALMDFTERLAQNPQPVVVDFWAPWCGPCRSIEPALKRLGNEYQGRVDVLKVNADEQPELLRGLRIYGIPTLIVFNAGREVTRRIGAQSPASLKDLFEAALNGEEPAPTGLAFRDRLLRVGAGLALLALGYFGGLSGLSLLFIALLGGVLLFSAVYDRCPIWKAIAPRVAALLQGRSQGSDGARSA